MIEKKKDRNKEGKLYIYNIYDLQINKQRMVGKNNIIMVMLEIFFEGTFLRQSDRPITLNAF